MIVVVWTRNASVLINPPRLLFECVPIVARRRKVGRNMRIVIRTRLSTPRLLRALARSLTRVCVSTSMSIGVRTRFPQIWFRSPRPVWDNSPSRDFRRVPLFSGARCKFDRMVIQPRDSAKILIENEFIRLIRYQWQNTNDITASVPDACR